MRQRQAHTHGVTKSCCGKLSFTQLAAFKFIPRRPVEGTPMIASLPRTTADPPARAATTSGALRSRRRPQWIAAGVLCLVLGALGAVWLFGQLGTSQTALQVTRPIARGEVIKPGDLRPVTIGSVPGVSIVGAAQGEQLNGQTALIDLAPGALLPADALGAAVVPNGKRQVGMRLAPGRLPAGALPPATKVLIVAVSAPGATSPTAVSIPAETSGPARVLDDGSALVDVLVANADAELVARWSAADQISLVREF